jgi:heptosyltransferase III
LKNYAALANLLNDQRFKVFFSGTKEEGSRYKEVFERCPHVVDLTGRLNLEKFITFISKADVLVASSTGPLHLAAASGINAFGIYAPMRPIHPGRWAPIGKKASYFVLDKDCSDCRVSLDCHCMREITPLQVFKKIEGS